MGICTSNKDSSSNKKAEAYKEKSKQENYIGKSNVLSNPNPQGSNSNCLEKIKDKFANSKNYIKNLNKETLIRKIMEVDGEQIIIENCTNSTIIILDYSSQVTIEKCRDCNIFIGPCKSR